MPEPPSNVLQLRTIPPVVPPGFLERPRLMDHLTAAASCPLTLLSAGPGHGKTLTLAGWSRQQPSGRVAWLSLDDSDNDPQAFWVDVLGALTSTGAIPPDSLLRDLVPAARFDTHGTALIAAGLGALPGPVVLVLDDFHVITDDRVLRSFERLLDHQPPQLRIVLATRIDPPLRLQRRRVAGELVDIRGGDLAFTEMETGKFLAGMGVHLTGAQLTALLDRTRGWAAGLRLAVLSLDPGDIDGAIDRFTGNDSLVAEYLIEEMLDRIPAADRRFLLTTSVTETISPPLANTLTGRTDSQDVLRKLVAENALLLELAGESEWYGYHPMLRELLLRRLDLEQPDTAGDLHRRAARWFAARADPVRAIRHACHAQDWELVGHLLVSIGWPLALTPSGPALVAALEPAVTAALREPTAQTLLAAAVVHYRRHEFDLMRQECDAAATLISDVPAVDRVAAECLIGTLRIAYSRIVHPADTDTVAAAQLGALDRAVDRPPPTAEHHRVIAVNNLAVGQLWAGRLDQAAANLHAARARSRELGIGLTELSVHGHLALLDVIHGDLPAASQRAEAAWNLAIRRGWTTEPQALGLRAAKAMVDLEQGQSAVPGYNDGSNYDGGFGGGDNEWVGTDVGCRLVLAIATIDQAVAGDEAITADEAAVRLDLIRGQAGRLPVLLAGWCNAAQAAADLAAGRWTDAINRVEASGVRSAFPDALGRIVVARARLLLDQPQQAIDTLQPLLTTAPRFRGPAVQARVLAAVAADRLHRDTAALTAFSQAVGLAHSVGMVRPFLTAGPGVAGLLNRHRHVVAKHLDFTDRLAAAIRRDHIPSPDGRPELEPLTGREMAVLVYLPTMLKAAEIADDLYVSVNTVKAHLRAIYRKLGVASRREAVEQARAYQLLT